MFCHLPKSKSKHLGKKCKGAGQEREKKRDRERPHMGEKQRRDLERRDYKENS